jgi:hypothetical protein
VIRRYLKTALLFSIFLEVSLSARGTKSSDVIDISKSVTISSRIPCDGATAPQDQVSAKASFSEGPSERSFMVSEFQQGSCKVNVKIHCFDKVKTGWRQDWAVTNTHPQTPSLLPLDSCYAWGSKEAAQYVVSGWYKPAGVNKKAPWVQATVKQVSSNPDVYEFTDAGGGTARLELSRR